MGLLLPIVGDAGGEGSTRMKGPIKLETQLFNVTVIPEYVPADKFEIVIIPLLFVVRLMLIGDPPFLMYCTL